MANLDERLRAAVGAVERRDRELAGELHAVRAGRARALAERSLESLSPPGGGAAAALGLESIVLRTGRPVLAVLNDEARLVFDDAESEVWRERLVRARELLGPAIRAVGRIEVQHHPLEWLGTGWLVAEDVVVTNRHVAAEFARRGGDGFVFRQGADGRAMTAAVDFLEELGREESLVFRIDEVLHVAGDDEHDLAFLRAAQTGGRRLASPIALSREVGREGQLVAAIGYPARDSRVPEQDLVQRIFGDVYDKKRLAPGVVTGAAHGAVLHDCSTLGGNSGSVVLDLESGSAVALHFAGRFLEANYAVPAPAVAEALHRLRRGAPSPAKDPGAKARVQPEALPPATEDSEDEEVLVTECRASDYAAREGYCADFLDIANVPLPAVLHVEDVLTFLVDGKAERVLRYEHFSVVMSRRRRLCWYSAVNVDGGASRRMKRAAWRADPRVGLDQQVGSGCYGTFPRFSRGHMTRREDPVWGDPATAARANADSMHVTNAVPQLQPFNAPIWLGLEDYALEHAREDSMRISVFTGPVLRDDDPVRHGVQIPRSFWKVIAFVHDATGELCATGYSMSQENLLREEEFVFGAHATAQLPLRRIEEQAGLSFGELRQRDPLERAPEGRAAAGPPLTDFRQIRFVTR